MGVHRLANGREVSLERLVLAPTYAGLLAGSPERATPGILEGAAERAASLLSPADPLTVVFDGRSPLPEWFCVAKLHSRRGALTNDSDYSSRLFVCWFTDNTTQSIDTMIEALLPHLDWENEADDYDMMP